MRPTYTLLFLLSILFLQASSRLTSPGPTGQTVAPSGKDYILYRPYPTRKPFVRSVRGSRGVTSSRRRENPVFSISELHPFHTVHDSPCANLKRSRVILTNGTEVFGRVVEARNLTGMFSNGESLVVMFYDGDCEWSREFWEVWAQVERVSGGVCMVGVDGRGDTVLNYNMMVFGFPSVFRMIGEKKVEVFRGERNYDAVLEWVVRVMGVPPMAGMKVGIGENVVDLRGGDGGVDWVLIGANFVTGANLIWAIVVGWRWIWGKKTGGVPGRER